MQRSSRFERAIGFRLKPLFSLNYDHLWFLYHKKMFGALIFRGRKVAAFKMMLLLRSLLKKKEVADPCLVFLISMMRITPEIHLTYVKIGARRQPVPLPINLKKRIGYAIRWTIKLLRDKNSMRYITVPAVAELLSQSLHNRGEAIKKKWQVYLLGSLNRHLLKRFMK